MPVPTKLSSADVFDPIRQHTTEADTMRSLDRDVVRTVKASDLVRLWATRELGEGPSDGYA